MPHEELPGCQLHAYLPSSMRWRPACRTALLVGGPSAGLTASHANFQSAATPWLQTRLGNLLTWQPPHTRSCTLPCPAGSCSVSCSTSTSSYHPVAAEQRPWAGAAPPGQAAGSGGGGSAASGQRDATTCQVGQLASTAMCLAWPAPGRTATAVCICAQPQADHTLAMHLSMCRCAAALC